MNNALKVCLGIVIAVPLLAAKTYYEERDGVTVAKVPVAAAEPAEPVRPGVFTPPQEAQLPDNAFGELVREGRDIFVDTRKNAAEFVGNGLNCSNCHLDQGRKADSAPLWGAYGMYPAYRKKNNKVNTFTERMQGCFEFSMNGKAPASDSHVMKALGTYAYWLATKAPVGEELPGRLYPVIPAPEKGFDLVKGKQIYAEQCAICHGAQGQGQQAAGTFVFPPLWGKDSYNWGAGMHRINTAAGFIKQNMPLGKGGSLSDDEAWHVAAWINSHERPQDPRLVDGSVEKTREKYHQGDGVNLYGEVVNGVTLGQGIN
ncbi:MULTISPECIES: c-type cytochrome [Pseudomonas]|jgi:thiosulfate dehydrogenase|uniref:c-type cytochrome n=1 Tax=Pseudomonas TaxID=286 RepID=UPI00062B1B31|nr:MULTISPECIES: c-type cytochrome [Pseudomonas]KKX60078.1 cytochrome C [Pseudomonas putida]OMQ29613.1 cytochrome C [Pseudomonas putida]